MALLLALLQLITGVGILSLFRIQLKTIFFFPLAVLLGIAVFSFVPFVLQLCFIPITSLTVFGSLLITAFFLNLKLLFHPKQVKNFIIPTRFRIELYDIPFLLVIIFLAFLSVWRCYYLPPAPFDAISGGELIAEYTIKEGTMINSAFAVEPNGNTLKPAFLTSLQVIYKIAGFPFGQVWLSNVFICFMVILYHLISKHIHRLLAGFLLLMFIAIPEMFGYTYMILYDYSNAVFFSLSIYFLIEFFKSQQRNSLLFSALLMAIATYIRPETPVLVVMLLPLLFLNQIKTSIGFWRTIKACLAFGLPSLLAYLISVTIYINFYLPQEYSVAEQINPNVWSVTSAFNSIGRATTYLIFSKKGIEYYSYFIYFFLLLFVAELIFKRRFSREAKNFLYAIIIVYLAYPLLNHLLPGLTIENSVKRGYFKMFPLMVLYMSNNELLKKLSEKVTNWENKTGQPELI